MSDRYPGGIISATAPEPVGPTDGEGGSAPGVWTMEQASYYEGVGQWPKKVLPRELYAWGSNSLGQVGDDTIILRSSPVQIGSDIDWVAVSANNNMNLARKSDGTLWSWGSGNFGCLGHNNVIPQSSPTQIGALTTWAKASNGFFNGGAVKTDGTLWTWGYNLYGQLGQNDVIARSSPVQVGSDTDWSDVEGGRYNCLAIKTDGTLWSWGLNTDVPMVGDSTSINRSSPVQIGALTNWLKLSAGAGSYKVAAIKTDGTLWGWGRDIFGEIGLNVTGNKNSPNQVGALTT